MVNQQSAKAGQQVGVGGHLARHLVKAVVGQRARSNVTGAQGFPEGCLCLFQGGQLEGCRIAGGKAQDRGIDHRGGKKEVPQGGMAHLGHAGTAVFADLHVPIACQLAQDLAQGSAGDFPFFGQGRFVQICPRLQRLRQNGVTQVIKKIRL